MSDVANDAKRGAPHGSVVMAEMQTAGRGRGQGRAWESRPKGNLYFTTLLRPSQPSDSSSSSFESHDENNKRQLMLSPTSRWMQHVHYSIVTAVARACRRSGVDARIKWPNDIWIRGKKVSGMLIDVVDGTCGVAVGIGINVHENMEENNTVKGTATSISDVLRETNESISRESLLADVLNLMEEHLSLYNSSGTSSTSCVVWDTYKRLDVTLGKTIEIHPRGTDDDDQAIHFAQAVDIDEHGKLIVELENGMIKHISSKVVSIRPNNKSNDRTTLRQLRSVVYIYNGKGTTKSSPKMVKRTLLDLCDPHFLDVQYISAKEICLGIWRQHVGYQRVAGIIFPGGADRHYAAELDGNGKLGNQHLKEYVEMDGGVYVGFCAGAYYGCSRVQFDIGGPLEVDEPRTLAFYAGSGIGPVFGGFEYDSERGSRAARVVLNAQEQEEDGQFVDVYYNGGCMFEQPTAVSSLGETDKERKERQHVTVTSWYAFDHNNSTSTKKRIASLKIQCKRGLAILCGVHPEYLPHQMIKTGRREVVRPILDNDFKRRKYVKYLLSPILERVEKIETKIFS